MEKIRLGRTNLMVSRIGMGGIPLTRPPVDEVVEYIGKALDLGVNFIDTAIGYSDSEERIGRAVEGRREEVYLATKTWAFDKETALKHIETSMERLRTDYIDIWQFHEVMTIEEYNQIIGPGGALEAAEEALEDGRIHHLGFSSHNLDTAIELVKSDRFETVQFPFNIISQEASRELVPLAKKHDVGFIAMKPFAGGMIKNAGHAIKYLLQYDNVLPDPGIEKLEEIMEIVSIINGPRELSTKDLHEIELFREKTGTRFCRQCDYCQPCPEGVLIRRIMYLEQLYHLWPADHFFEWDYVTEGIASSKNCVKCGQCETKCPYKLPIREMIQEKTEFYDRVKSEYLIERVNQN